MARKTKEACPETLSVSVDECRARVQTGEATVFIDARKAEDWDAKSAQIAGSIRVSIEPLPPRHQRNYIVVYCA